MNEIINSLLMLNETKYEYESTQNSESYLEDKSIEAENFNLRSIEFLFQEIIDNDNFKAECSRELIINYFDYFLIGG